MLKLVIVLIPFSSLTFIINIPANLSSSLARLPRSCDFDAHGLHVLAKFHIYVARSD